MEDHKEILDIPITLIGIEEREELQPLICPFCKHEIRREWVSCPYCGVKLHDDTQIY